MKKLSSLFKKLQSTKLYQGVFVGCAAYALSCQSSVRQDLRESPPEAGTMAAHVASEGLSLQASPPQHGLEPASTHELRLFPAFLPSQTFSHSELNPLVCSTGQELSLALHLPVKHPYLANPLGIKFELGGLPSRPQAMVKVASAKQVFFLPVKEEELAFVRLGLCSLQQGETPGHKERLYSIISAWLRQTLPDCQLQEVPGEGWTCGLESGQLEAVLASLRQLEQESLLQWKRQPYLYQRRLTLTMQLAKILASGPEPKELERFCSLLSFSDSKELPLAMSLEEWQAGFCHQAATESRPSWGLFAVEHALQELTFLQTLINKTNSTGNLRVHIPEQLHPTTELWVQLQPSLQVLEQVLATAQGISPRGKKDAAHLSSLGEGTEAGLQPLCWHPLYSQDSLSFQAASLMGLIGQKPSPCLPERQSEEPSFAAGAYLYESIMGETTFLVNNGQSRVLSLPTGDYTYTLYNLPANAKRWSPSQLEDKSQGQISWTTPKPQAVIARW